MNINAFKSALLCNLLFQLTLHRVPVVAYSGSIKRSLQQATQSACQLQVSPNVLPILNSTALVSLKVEGSAYKIVNSKPIPKKQPPLGSEAFRKNVGELAFSSDLIKKAGNRIVSAQATSGTTALELSACMRASH